VPQTPKKLAARHALEAVFSQNFDHLCTFVDLLQKPKKTFIYNLSFLLLKISLKYGLMVQKTNKDVGTVLNLLSTFNA